MGDLAYSSSSDELNSDEELQEEFSKGNLQSGLIVRAAPVKTYTNNVSGMRSVLAELKEKELEWLERMDVTAISPDSKSEDRDEVERTDPTDPEDDFKREMHFYHQAQSSVPIGLQKLEELKVPSRRPDDYFAEMVKTDDHMRKIREGLLSRQKILEQREKSRKLRELKKYGKKVQHEVLQKRRRERKSALEAVKKFKKGKGEQPSFLGRTGDDEDGFSVTTETLKKSAQQSGGKKTVVGKSKKQIIKDKKFGFGGKKRWSKSNTAESSADMSSFDAAKHSRKTQRPGGGGGGGARGRKGKGGGVGRKNKNNNKPIRLGKSRRQKLKK